MPDIDIGQLSEVINDKMDRDLNNRSTDSGLRRLIESYHNGSDWYKVFEEIQSDGTTKQWCEQGGVITGTGTQTINLFKPFSSTDYSIINSVAYSSIMNDVRPINTSNKTTNSFQIFMGTVSGVYAYWKAEGYIS